MNKFINYLIKVKKDMDELEKFEQAIEKLALKIKEAKEDFRKLMWSNNYDNIINLITTYENLRLYKRRLIILNKIYNEKLKRQTHEFNLS